MARTGLPIFMLIVVAAIASVFLNFAQWISSPTVDKVSKQRTLPQTYLYQVRSWTFDEQGALSDIMEAATIEHFKRRDESLLKSPRFYSHNGSDKTWSAVADRGRYRPSTERLKLYDNVILSNDASGGRLTTQAMTIDLKRKIARSNVPVLITQGLSSSRADGMVANLRKEQIKMQPNVESIYVQPE